MRGALADNDVNLSPNGIREKGRVQEAQHSLGTQEQPMSSLQGRVAIITGASRGIGRALALGLARHGCSVVIAAKSIESTKRLPGSIYTVAREVEALGVPALPVQVDVRDVEQIEALAA